MFRERFLSLLGAHKHEINRSIQKRLDSIKFILLRLLRGTGRDLQLTIITIWQ